MALWVDNNGRERLCLTRVMLVVGKWDDDISRWPLAIKTRKQDHKSIYCLKFMVFSLALFENSNRESPDLKIVDIYI